MTDPAILDGVLHGLCVAYLIVSGEWVWRAKGNAVWQARWLWSFALFMWGIHFGQDLFGRAG